MAVFQQILTGISEGALLPAVNSVILFQGH